MNCIAFLPGVRRAELVTIRITSTPETKLQQINMGTRTFMQDYRSKKSMIEISAVFLPWIPCIGT
jgi:hypothetical protein